MMEWLFWISASLVAYGTIGYPSLIWILAKLAPKPVRKADILPIVTCVIAARNEEQTIGTKIENLLSSDYPPDRLDIIVVSDGSADTTAAIVEEWAHRAPTRVRLLTIPIHHGKAHALNVGVAAATGEIILFADARQRFASDAVRALVANFADPDVGAVCGELILEATGHGTVGEGLGFYWQYEKFLRKAESVSGSTVVCTGAIYAIRKACFLPLPEGTLVDDLLTPMRLILAGHRVVFEPKAVAFDSLSPSSSEEFARKVRTLAGNIQVLCLEPGLLNPLWLKHSWRYLSHMVLPRILMPYCLLALFVSSLLSEGPFYFSLLVGQITFYLGGIVALRMGAKDGRLLKIPGTFLLLNLAALAGATRYAVGSHQNLWRRQPAPSVSGDKRVA